MNVLKRFMVGTLVVLTSLVGAGTAMAAPPTPAEVGIQAEGGGTTLIQSGTGWLSVRWSAQSRHTIWWGEGEFVSSGGVGNPKIVVTFFYDNGQIFDESSNSWGGRRMAEKHHRDINQSVDRAIVTVCAALFEGSTYLNRACAPITA
ncbi:hypothetical protein [Amycolatopsis coloradensis]|nr:hypothetical protein [Amycolatopsis coloradensis]